MSPAYKRIMPAKPRKDFPLFARSNGQWAAKIGGKLRRIGSWANDPKGVLALERWNAEKEDLRAGRIPLAAHMGRRLIPCFIDLCVWLLTLVTTVVTTWDRNTCLLIQAAGCRVVEQQTP